MKKGSFLLVITIIFGVTCSFSQSTFLDSLITANLSTFKYQNGFSGSGWDKLIESASKTNYVLIGEDHFMSEMPVFTEAIASKIHFDNYISEIDPWLARLFAHNIGSMSTPQLDKWIDTHYTGFSFFQKKNEFDLLRSLVKQKTNLIGFEQVTFMSTTIMYEYLLANGSAKNKKLYQELRDSSEVVNQKYFEDAKKNPFYMSTKHFKKKMQLLDRSVMKQDEKELIEAMLRSADIFETGSHSARIKLMQSNFMKFYEPLIKGKKNLFKFGANHPMKGASFIPVYDIGTTANVLAQSENMDSYHVLVFAKSGVQGQYFSGNNVIDLNNPFFAAFKPLFDQASDTEWTYFDLKKIRNALDKEDIKIENTYLSKSVNGYDAMVIIPVATAAEPIRKY